MTSESVPQVHRWRAFAVLAVSSFMTIVEAGMVNVADRIEGSVALSYGPGASSLAGAGNNAGVASLAVQAGTGTSFAPGLAEIQDGTASEMVRIIAVAANTVTIAPGLAASHSAGTPLIQVRVTSGGFGPRSPYLTGAEMSIRQVQATVTVAAPDVYGTPTTFYAGQILDMEPGGIWETLVGAANVPVLAGSELTATLNGSGSAATGNA